MTETKLIKLLQAGSDLWISFNGRIFVSDQGRSGQKISKQVPFELFTKAIHKGIIVPETYRIADAYENNNIES